VRLAVIGSNKGVTTANAVLTEVFTGLRPNEVLILAEEQSPTPNGLAKALWYLGIKAKLSVTILGGPSTWKENVSKVDTDVLDVTPGRKYMALFSSNYSKSKEVRYVYLKREVEGYRTFGYVPFQEVEVWELREGRKLSYNPPDTEGNLPNQSLLKVDSLRGLYNILTLRGKVDYDYDNHNTNNPDQWREVCSIRAGAKRFRQEDKIQELARQGHYFLADTNVYINLGPRVRELTKGKILASKSVYRELTEKIKTTQKGIDMKFHVGMGTFREIHRAPPVGEGRGGDISLLEETKRLKTELSEPLTLLTSDNMVSQSGKAYGVDALYLNGFEKGEANHGELLYCLAANGEVRVSVDDQEVVKLNMGQVVDRITRVQSLNPKINYGPLLQELENLIGRESVET
jgi:hypothetical protein